MTSLPRLEELSMYSADLYSANLRGANLRGANLYSADLYSADLRGANLRGADLYSANLRGANLRGANLYSAKIGDRIITVTDWCDLLDLAHCGDDRRIAFKRLPDDRVTGRKFNGGKNLIEWSRGSTVEAPDWSDDPSCGGGLHLSPTPNCTWMYSNHKLVVPVAFDPNDAVLLGDKIKVRKCEVLG